MALTTVETVALGTVAGGTVYLGLPVARFPVSNRTTHLLSGGAIGVLLFLIVDVLHGALEPVESALSAPAPGASSALLAVALVIGFGVGLVGLTRFNERYVGGQTSTRATAAMVAVGIGFHNFSEGLAIGQSAASGAVSLAVVLIVGFALHNVTEGFGIAAPLSNTDTTTRYLAGLGLVAGGPTFLGTVIGEAWSSPVASVLFLSLAGGALVYVVQQLLGVDRPGVPDSAMFSALTVGFLAAFATEVVVHASMVA